MNTSEYPKNTGKLLSTEEKVALDHIDNEQAETILNAPLFEGTYDLRIAVPVTKERHQAAKDYLNMQIAGGLRSGLSVHE